MSQTEVDMLDPQSNEPPIVARAQPHSANVAPAPQQQQDRGIRVSVGPTRPRNASGARPSPSQDAASDRYVQGMHCLGSNTTPLSSPICALDRPSSSHSGHSSLHDHGYRAHGKVSPAEVCVA